MHPDRSNLDVDNQISPGPSSYGPMTKKEIFRKPGPRRGGAVARRNGVTTRLADRSRDRRPGILQMRDLCLVSVSLISFFPGFRAPGGRHMPFRSWC